MILAACDPQVYKVYIIHHFFPIYRYNTARTLPPYDSIQNFYDREVEVEDGKTTISFNRLIVTNDTDDDISLDECRYVLWAYGGPVTSYGSDGNEGVFGGHTDKGVFSDKICLCGKDKITLCLLILQIRVTASIYFFWHDNDGSDLLAFCSVYNRRYQFCMLCIVNSGQY